MACEDVNSKLVEVVTVADVDVKKHVDNSLVQIWNLKFGHEINFFCPDFEHKVCSRFWSWSSGEILKLKFSQYFAADPWLRLWGLFLVEILKLRLVKILKFKNSTLGLLAIEGLKDAVASLFGEHLKVNNVWKISNNCCSFILDNSDTMSKQLPEKRSKQNIKRILYVRLAIVTNTCTQNCQPHDWQLVWQFIVIPFNLERLQYSFPALWFKSTYDNILQILFASHFKGRVPELCVSWA